MEITASDWQTIRSVFRVGQVRIVLIERARAVPPPALMHAEVTSGG